MDYQFNLPISAQFAVGERREISKTIANDSYFIVEKLVAYYDGAFKCLPRDTAVSNNWSNIMVRAENLFGTAQFPNRLRTPLVLPPSSTVTFDIQNLYVDPANPTAANYIQISLEGYRCYSVAPKYNKRFYVNAVDFALPASNMLDTTLTISALGDFEVQKMVRFADGQAEVKMSASSLSGRQLSDGLVRIDNIFGSATNPNALKHPYTLVSNSIIQIYALNKEASVNNVQLCFEGAIKLGIGQTPEVI